MSEEKKPSHSLSPAVLFGISALVVIIIGLIIAVVILAGRNQKLESQNTPADTQVSGEAVPGSDSLQSDTSDNSSSVPASSEAVTSSESTGSSETGSSPQTSSEAVESTPASSEADPLPEGAEIILSYEVGNSWGEGSNKNCTVEMSLQNASSSPINGWELVLEVNGLTGAEGWNGTYTMSGGKLHIKNAEHNKNIALGEKAYFGATMSFSDKFEIQKATLNGVECAVQKTRVNQNEQNNQQAKGEGSATVDPAVLLERSPSAKQGDDWLYTDGHRILDKDGKEVWLTGLNWFGYNTGTNLFDGLWNSKLEPTVVGIADHGFNLIRVPFSAELINQWAAGDYPRANYNNAYNPVLNDMNSLQIFDYFLKLAEENGIKVMIDIHSAETNASGHMANLWYTERVSVEDYYKALEWMADRYKNNDTIIAYDLKNEPHGKPNEGKQAAIWNDSNDANNWKKVAETAAGKVLAKNPNVLILVEGLEIYPKNSNGDYSSADSEDYYFNWWGGNLRAVADFPIDLGKYQNKLVYSPHDYGPTVYEQPWFKGDYTYDSLMKDCWRDNWLYIQEDDIAPLLIGEWGGFMRDPNLKWMTYMRQLIGTYHLNHTFWCLNANSGDTGGLLLDDFTTWDTEKYNFVKEVLWQENGKFVGLDHEIPLGKNGITLSNAKGLK